MCLIQLNKGMKTQCCNTGRQKYFLFVFCSYPLSNFWTSFAIYKFMFLEISNLSYVSTLRWEKNNVLAQTVIFSFLNHMM